MCISLRLKTNLTLATYFFKQTDLCAKAQLNATVCLFADIISLRRGIFFWDRSEIMLNKKI
jgi:hypothetical protein